MLKHKKTNNNRPNLKMKSKLNKRKVKKKKVMIVNNHQIHQKVIVRIPKILKKMKFKL